MRSGPGIGFSAGYGSKREPRPVEPGDEAGLAEVRFAQRREAARERPGLVLALCDPALAACVLPDDGQSLDIPGFLRETGTLYLIAETRGQDAPVAPLFACLASEIHHTERERYL
jgi:hypothetical protein